MVKDMLINVNEKRMRLTLAVKMRDNEQFLQNFEGVKTISQFSIVLWQKQY